ncbi:MAG: CsgG/HfaB family protein [Spirochaetia bacterium]|nr:CsgG/HfaB family protein [Spirochaetia bacterium]
MRVKIITMLIFMLSLKCATPPIYYNKRAVKENATIAVMPFSDYLEKNNSGQLFTNIFSIFFMRDNYKLAEREKISQIMREKSIDISHITESSTKEIGDFLNVDYLLIGSVTDYTSYSSEKKLFYIFEWLQITCSVGVTARLIDVNTGEVIWVGSATDQSYSYQQAVEAAIGQLYLSIINKR